MSDLFRRPALTAKCVPACLRRKRCFRHAAVVLCFMMLSVWATWPLVRLPWSQLPSGRSLSAAVPVLNMWSIWWNADRAAHGFADYWNAPIFFPVDGTFAFSEPQPATLMVAPVIWLTGSRVLATNLYLLISLILNGVFARQLLAVCGVRRSVALAGGCLVVLLPLVHEQVEVLQLVPLWGILWTWKSVLQASRRLNWRRSMECGLACGVTFLCCGHHGLFLCVLLTATIPLLPFRWTSKQTWLMAIPALALTAVMVLPWFWKLRDVSREHEFHRSTATVQNLSAQWGDYLRVTGDAVFLSRDSGERAEWRLSPGWIKTLLAGAGLVYGLRRRRFRRLVVFLLANFLLALLLSLGTNLVVATWHPWHTLAEVVPGFDHVRNVFRFAFFVQLSLVLLASIGAHGVLVGCRSLIRGSEMQHLLASETGRCLAGWLPGRAMSRGLAVAGVLVALFETIPSPVVLVGVPDSSADTPWIQFVREHTRPGSGIVCLPMSSGNRVADFEESVQWMYHGTWHGQPLVNGYSGYFPDGYFTIRGLMQSDPTGTAALGWLRRADVDLLVVHTGLVSDEPFRQASLSGGRLQSVFRDDSGIRIYRLR